MTVLALDTASPGRRSRSVWRTELFEEPLPGTAGRRKTCCPRRRRFSHAPESRSGSARESAFAPDPARSRVCASGLATAWGLGRATGIPVESRLHAGGDGRGRARAPGISRRGAVLDAGRGEVVLERFDSRARSRADLRDPARLPLERAVALSETERDRRAARNLGFRRPEDRAVSGVAPPRWPSPARPSGGDRSLPGRLFTRAERRRGEAWRCVSRPSGHTGSSAAALVRPRRDRPHRAESFRIPWKREFFASELVEPHRYLVCSAGDDGRLPRIGGYLFAVSLYEEFHINKIATDRGCAAGYGRRLLEDALARRGRWVLRRSPWKCASPTRRRGTSTVLRASRRRTAEARITRTVKTRSCSILPLGGQMSDRRDAGLEGSSRTPVETLNFHFDRLDFRP